MSKYVKIIFNNQSPTPFFPFLFPLPPPTGPGPGPGPRMYNILFLKEKRNLPSDHIINI